MGGGSGGKLPVDTKPALLDHHHHLATTTAACPAAAGKFMKLPPLEHAGGGGGPLLSPTGACEYGAAVDAHWSGIADWDALDRLASYELNGLSDASSKNMAAAFFDVDPGTPSAFSSSSSAHAVVEGDLWSLARSVSALHAADLTMNSAGACAKTRWAAGAVVGWEAVGLDFLSAQSAVAVCGSWRWVRLYPTLCGWPPRHGGGRAAEGAATA